MVGSPADAITSRDYMTLQKYLPGKITKPRFALVIPCER